MAGRARAGIIRSGRAGAGCGGGCVGRDAGLSRHWLVADVRPAILADVYLRSGAAAAPPPSKTTIWRVLTDADAGAFDVAVGRWLMSLAGFTAPAGRGPARRTARRR